ncbi:hypothetical protein Cni_G11177 [Canna indica]|uniref:Uncharacterized protein n=1 Tax=Canna indica TaxID=4628 RepID=A0AAQ3QAZ8_9LILI|nr:hypothetical protein Cni_G11177 [Canna indica]
MALVRGCHWSQQFVVGAMVARELILGCHRFSRGADELSSGAPEDLVLGSWGDVVGKQDDSELHLAARMSTRSCSAAGTPNSGRTKVEAKKMQTRGRVQENRYLETRRGRVLQSR